jgi:hypothetical protein
MRVVVDARFSSLAAIASAAVALLAATNGAPVAAGVWAVLAIGFIVRATIGFRRR